MVHTIAPHLLHFLQTYGYVGIFFIVAAESMGLLVPAETTLITASVYAGTTHHLNIVLVVVSAIAGAILGDNLGYFIGSKGGFPLLHTFGKYLKLDEKKLKVGQYLFLKHGGKIVFFGRFISFLRAWAAFLAGVNRMHWKYFLFYNAAGGIIWATYYGILGYVFGRTLRHVSGPLRFSFLIIGIILVVVSFLYVSINFKSLEKKAEKELPGKLQ
jgi:membrane protein DedA with SNARE-associated domain